MSANGTSDLRSAPWWSELLAIKDSFGWAALARRFGVTEAALRRAMEEAGVTKAPGVPGRKPKRPAAPGVVHVGDPLDLLREDMGKVADATIAEKAGVTRWQVARYRARHGIPAYDGFRFVSRATAEERAPGAEAEPTVVAPVPAVREAPRAPAPVAPRSAPRARPAPVAPVAPVAPPAPPAPVAPPAPAVAAAPAAAPRPAGRSGLQAYLITVEAGAPRRFVVLAPDMVGAAKRAKDVVARQGFEGSIDAIQWIAEVLT